ncbi:hypothetical protein [Gracilinema caldarium]|uniref:hypothetical protein n=1 Tax=Gracilinema caldarium TaxID=215591 RepID=UPI0026ECB439|nr:hypothetical protein [Gracilinema caldarium]
MNTWIEWFGTFASVMVAVSLTLKNIKRLRIVNLIGSLAFAIYGFLISAWPVFGLNAFIVLVNSYYLYVMARDAKRPETFEILYVNLVHDEYAQRFLQFYGSDIRKFFPSFPLTGQNDYLASLEACFILRQTVPVSLVVYRRDANGDLSILMDYAIPAYRDLKNAKFFLETAISNIARTAKVVHAQAEVQAHEAYLKKLGFTKVGTSGAVQLYQKNLG